MPEARPATSDLEAVLPEISDTFDALERGDQEYVVASVERLCHPDVDLTSAVSGRLEGKRTGREAVKDFFMDLLDVWEHLSYTNRQYEIVGDDAIVTRHTMRTQGRGSGVGLLQTAGAILRFDGGLIRSAVTFVDDEELDRAAGVIAVEATFRLLAEGGPEALLDHYDQLFHEDFEWQPALIGGVDGRTYRGRADFERYWRDFTDAFEEIAFGAPQVEALGSGRLMAWGNLHVRGSGGGVPIEQEAAYVIDVRDYRIAAGRTFFSRAEAEEFARA
jgi:ketosteroid isomerase-like protein